MTEIEINFDDFKVRCSAITKILSESRDNPCITEKQLIFLAELDKKEKLTDNQKAERTRLIQLKDNSTKVVLSDTCIDYLMECYSWITTKKISVSKEAMDLMQMQKGILAEDDGIEIMSILDDRIYTKNKERKSNDYLTGIPDVFTGEEIMKAEIITDVKLMWDYPIFLKNIKKKLEQGYLQQVQGYCDITGASEGQIAKILVNTPQEIINEMQYKLAKKMGAMTIESPEFLKEWEQWERSMNFNDIPIRQRIFKIPVQPFTEFEKQKVYDRVKICREWLSNFHEDYKKFNQ
jgi:hypothetical protein